MEKALKTLENHRSDDNAVLDSILLNINEFDKVYTGLTGITDTVLSLVYDTEEIENIVKFEDVDITNNDTKFISKESLRREYGEKINEIYLNKFNNQEKKPSDRLTCYIDKIYFMNQKHDETVLKTLNEILALIDIDSLNDNKKLINILKTDSVLFDSCKEVLLKLLFDDPEFGFKLNIDNLLLTTKAYRENLIEMINSELTAKNMNNIIVLLNKLKTIDVETFAELRLRFIEAFKKEPIKGDSTESTNDKIDELYENYLIKNYNINLESLV